MYLTIVTLNDRFIREKLYDYEKIHKFVQCFFNTSRKKSDALYHIYEQGNVLKMIIQSNMAPDDSQNARYFEKIATREICPEFQNGGVYSFRFSAYPTKKEKSDNGKSRRTLITDGYERFDWLKRKAEEGGFVFTSVRETGKERHMFTKDGRRAYTETFSYIGSIEITDKDKFIAMLQKGIGAGKAYGNGLLVVK